MRRNIPTGPWTGAPLQRARIAAGMSRSDLARRVATEPGCERVSPETVRCNEPGEGMGKAPNATLLGAYARALGVTADALLAIEAAVDPDPDPTIEVDRAAIGLPPRS